MPLSQTMNRKKFEIKNATLHYLVQLMKEEKQMWEKLRESGREKCTLTNCPFM